MAPTNTNTAPIYADRAVLYNVVIPVLDRQDAEVMALMIQGRLASAVVVHVEEVEVCDGEVLRHTRIRSFRRDRK